MALVMNAIHLLDATLVSIHILQNLYHNFFFFFFFFLLSTNLLHFHSKTTTFELSSKYLSFLLSKHLPNFL